MYLPKTEIDVEEMIVWVKHSIVECEKSIVYYMQHPEMGKRDRMKDCVQEREHLFGRIALWEGML
jgi:hypothetical protein